jgi:alpha-1,2-rhamnosyltransferase
VPTRVFIEGTTTYVAREVGGIHRVVRKIVEQMQTLHEEFDVESAPVVLRARGLCNASSLAQSPITQTPMSGLAGACGRAADWLITRDPITWKEKDLLLMLDATWGKAIWRSVQNAKQRGVVVGVMVHDLIPVHYPQFFAAKVPSMFREWLDAAVEHADFFVGNSQTTVRDLQQYVLQSRTRRQWTSTQFDSFRLGADFPNVHGNMPVREVVRSFFTGATSPYLLVCTIEPRKNHSYLLDAFDRIWQKSPEAKLCIVGKIGWRCDQVVARIREHPQFGKSLMMFSDLTDAELRFCYRNAKAFVFPSIVEGFGLPIVEALGHGLRVLASDTPIHREVGQEHCRYFDLDDANSLVRMILQMERSALPDALQTKPYRVVTWEESCRELLTKSLRMAGMGTVEGSCGRSASRGLKAAA